MIQVLQGIQLIIGLGKTGLSCAQYLNERGLPFRAMDTRDVAPFAEQIGKLSQCRLVLCGNPDLHLEAMDQYLDDVERIIISPGLAITGLFFDLVKRHNIPIIGDIAVFAQTLSSQAIKAPVIAITGSNGKSTVTQLTAELLEAAGKNVLVGGNIGIPALQLLSQPEPDFYVLELSSFQLETTTTLRPIAGTVLNISADHMDRHDSLEHYSAVKMSLLDYCQNVVINRDEFSPLMHRHLSSSAKDISFAVGVGNEECDYTRQQQDDGRFWIYHTDYPLIAEDELKIAGLHNVSNAMAALALCNASGVTTNDAMLEKLRQWPGLEHRCEFIAEKQGVRCYNDSKATNVGATVAALEGLAATATGKIILLAGGDGKGADFSPLADLFNTCLSALILIGKDAERLQEEAANGITSVIVADMKEAVLAAFSYAKAGDIILLSPACASLDMYKNFEQRGNVFRQEVEALL